LLVVARGIRNQRYNAIKLALGGTRWRIVRPYIIESGIVSLLGCIVGLLIARWGSNLGASFVPGDWQIGVTPSVIAIAIGLAVATTLLGGILAAYVSSRSSIQEVLQQSNRTTQPHVTLRAGLLATQFAVSVVLVYSTLFYVDDFAGLTRADVGLDVKNLHVFELSGRLPRRELGNDYFQRLTSELKAVPGVESVGMSGGAPPLSFLRDLTEPVQSDDGREVAASVVCVFPGVFESWRARRLTGRDLEWTDGPSALVTENLARRLYPNGDALARRIRTKTPPVRDLAIVGIVGNMAFNGPRLGMRNVVFMQCLERTHPWPSNFAVQIFIRSSRGLAEVGRDVSKVVDRIGIYFVYSMDDEEQFLAWSTDQERVLATVSSAFGGLILALTGVGLYAFCSYMLAFRNRELAIRAGLGASPRAIATALLRETIVVLTVGLIVGLGLTLALQRVMAGLIVDVGSMSIGNLLQAVLILFAMALAASVLPMMRALRIDLARALRVD